MQMRLGRNPVLVPALGAVADIAAADERRGPPLSVTASVRHGYARVLAGPGHRPGGRCLILTFAEPWTGWRSA